MTREDDLRYTTEHEWVDASDGVATVGVTAYAAGRLGDVVYVDLPTVGQLVEAGHAIGEIESTKSVNELFSPVSGNVTAVNDAVAASPELVNSDPLGEGWLVKVAYQELPELLGVDEYRTLTAE